MFNIFKKNASQTIEHDVVPEHIAIIMDGNGRWAKNRKMPRVKGHYEGMQTVKRITTHASQIGVKYLTLYAFSTENWSRPKEEVNYLMKLPVDFLASFLPDLMKNNVKVESIGFIEQLPEHTKEALYKVQRETENNTGMKLIFALNYGGRKEIVAAVQLLAAAYKNNEIQLDDIDEERVGQALFTRDYPDPELLIRTSGEERLSNFMLWQTSYSEFVFDEKLWPDYAPEDLDHAIHTYCKRQRRFGGLNG
ncbi:isoprenyl transferase [Macrococcus brunensis]|uniref:isoprenyl transferase n=1 Tax=Macrococcus brunensis TaxID=198483 RepID=UPI001EF0F335|nr:isoprenyl transferase [Macrococcus brunensis]ULG72907.1 isoprenyl transferase [Macrococcus brunensis]ULG75155.1 isoprenyl transferase [Macrococcus brunensis]